MAQMPFLIHVDFSTETYDRLKERNVNYYLGHSEKFRRLTSLRLFALFELLAISSSCILRLLDYS